MKRYGVLYEDKIFEIAGELTGCGVRWPSFTDDDGRFGTNNINEAYQFMAQLNVAFPSAHYTVAEKVRK